MDSIYQTANTERSPNTARPHLSIIDNFKDKKCAEYWSSLSFMHKIIVWYHQTIQNSMFIICAFPCDL